MLDGGMDWVFENENWKLQCGIVRKPSLDTSLIGIAFLGPVIADN